MPVDYSRFNSIGDSDSEGSQKGLDLSNLLSRSGAPDSPPESPRDESPRAALQRSLAPPPAEQPAEEATSGGQVDGNEPGSGQTPQPATLDRFAELAEGAEVARGDDSLELLAVARATVQSALADGQSEAPCRLVRALAVGLAARPKAVAFAREQAPELVADLLIASSSDLVPSGECEQVLGLMGEKCKPRELYTFLIEALCGDELVGSVRIRGIRLLRATFSRMDESKRHLFLASCLPVLLKKSFETKMSAEIMVSELEALREFALDFLPPKDDGNSEVGPAKVAESMVTAFLLKVTLKALPVVVAVEGLGLAPMTALSGETESEPDSKRPRSNVGQNVGQLSGNRALQLRCNLAASVLKSLSNTARAGIESSSKPLFTLLEEMDIGDPTTDGGGNLEVSPLCLAAVVCLLELHGCWRDLQPQVIPIGLSAARRVNILMRSCFVLISNGDVASNVCTLGEADTANPGAVSGPRWAHRGLALFAASVAPLVRLVAVQTPAAYASPSGPLCRWYPARILRALLESLASTPDIDREVRGTLFRAVGDVFRAFAWPCRFDLYFNIISKCRVDSIIGAVVTMFKDDWWARVRSAADAGESMSEERGRLTKVFQATLSGDVQVVDGMDTLTAALNVARLVALAQAPVGPFIREALRKGGPGVDLDGMLAGVSKQIDVELGLLDKDAGHDGSLSGEFAQAVEEALGKSEGGVNFKEMKRDRITMVAHLVARVRELLSSAAN